jgi:4-oxalocrotonate tautomerase
MRGTTVHATIPDSRFAMPYVNVRITRGDITAEQKSQVVAEITQTLQRVLGKQPKHTHVVIDEIDEENWGFAGRLTSEWARDSVSPPSVQRSNGASQ